MALLSKEEVKSWRAGIYTNAHKKLGAHRLDNGFWFAVWAPNADSVHVTGDFNDWDKAAHPMEKDSETGVWQRVVKSAQPGQCYKFCITPKDGPSFLKSDPYGRFHEHEGQHASILWNFPDFSWSDDSWMQSRTSIHRYDRPLSIYEVHLGSWRRAPSGRPLTYSELSEQLIPYVKEMGFTHIELLPVMEHPYGPSWGYQVTGFFAPTSRYGRPEDFMAFIDCCHQNDLGVIFDWVPGHFPRDGHGLAFFDGTALYEHHDRRRREHGDWGTYNFDFEKPGVRNFLLSNAFFWCEKYHIDGFRVDAVASMLYLDYSKGENDWLPNEHGGKENLGALSFLKDFNRLVNRHDPSVLTIAEESTAWPGVTRSVDEGGLGFDYKWNMGWMNDTLHFFELPAGQRNIETHSVTFPVTFAFSERFILPFSHDEVVHLKKSLWSKMPGSEDQKFKQLKLLFLYIMGYPGKKLLFMGSELAEMEEWSERRGLHWSLLDGDRHKDIQEFVAALLDFYPTSPPMYEKDHEADGFSWVDLSHKEEAIYVFERESGEKKLIFLFNFSLDSFDAGKLAIDWEGNSYSCVFDTLQPAAGNNLPGLGHTRHSFVLQPLQGLLLEA